MVLFEGGLCRVALTNSKHYDAVDFAPYLKKVENAIAILVWYKGRTFKPHEDSGQGGLFMSVDWYPYLSTNDSCKIKVAMLNKKVV